MGRAFESEELDRPDLNKCPDCGCLFASENCPLCGKICPDEFRAGNRKAVKKKKRTGGSSGRVVFVEWYHSWWFILIMMFVMPILGIILLATSPHKKSVKIAVIVLATVWTIASYVGIGNVVSVITNKFSEPVNNKLEKQEYIDICKDTSAEDFYRNSKFYEGEFVCLTVEIIERIIDIEGYYSGNEYNTYYVCKSKNGGEFEILVRDCIQDIPQKFIVGDIITVYGEGAGDVSVCDADYITREAPCIYAAYVYIDK